MLDVVFLLSPADQIELIDRLRDRLRGEAAGAEPPALPDEHRRVLDERLDALDRGTTTTTPWETIEARLLARVGGK